MASPAEVLRRVGLGARHGAAPHHVSGPAKFVDHFTAAIAEAVTTFEVIPLFSEFRSGNRFDALSLPTFGDLELIERTCSRFVTPGQWSE
jgi:hypothetical protein